MVLQNYEGKMNKIAFAIVAVGLYVGCAQAQSQNPAVAEHLRVKAAIAATQIKVGSIGVVIVGGDFLEAVYFENRRRLVKPPGEVNSCRLLSGDKIEVVTVDDQSDSPVIVKVSREKSSLQFTTCKQGTLVNISRYEVQRAIYNQAK